MQISAGSRVGSYEITGALGAGAMGNVYRARDHRLARDVAIKALPDDLARDPDALARFEREARFLATLNHANIAAIYGIEEVAGERVLVLELVHGETLEDRLMRGRIPLPEVLRIAIQIADALEAAHAADIVHRDLKPSNVRMTADGRVKLLDFGIAKHAAAPGRASRRATLAPALDPTITRSGAVVGTPAYMSPEQLFGEPVDERADVWAFGCVLYEMLTGCRAFPGGTFLQVADAIRASEPDWRALPRGTPDALRRLVARCLVKDPRDRLHDIGDARLELEEIAAPTGRSPTRMPRSTIAALAVLAVLVLASVVLLLARAAPRDGEGSAALRLTQLTSAEGVEEFPAWSPDGQSIVYAGDVGGIRKLFVRRLGAADAEQLTVGDHDDLQPTWSPDGKRVLFVRAREARRHIEPSDVFAVYGQSEGDVWSIDLPSRREARFVEGAFYPSVSPDGRSVAVDASWAGPRRIWVVDANGFNPQQVTADSSEAASHVLPRWAPDGHRIVYQRVVGTRFAVAVVDVASRKSVTVLQDPQRKINPAWGPDGRTIYYTSDAGGGWNLWQVPVDAASRPTGPPRQLTTGAGQDVQVAVSPDGSRLAYTTLHQNADLWRLPMTPDGAAAGPPEPVLASTREDSRGSWSPDGQQLAFNSDRAGPMNLWVHSLRDGSTRQVTHGPGGDFQPEWSPDGRTLVFFSSRAGQTDIWSVELASGRLTKLTSSRSLAINPFFSPDGREIVFLSDASGRPELWVMNADGSRPHQLTTAGAAGHFIRWLRDGYIYFGASPVRATARVSSRGGEPQIVSRDGGSHLSFSPDGSHFVDVVGHKVLWLHPLHGPRRQLFAFDDADVRIDYPVWSPDGRWLVFDRFRPEGGDVWMAEGIGRR